MSILVQPPADQTAGRIVDLGLTDYASTYALQLERGGDITYHGRGQLVIYPVLHLRQAGLTVTEYVHCLEEIMIRLAATFMILGERCTRNCRVAEAIVVLGLRYAVVTSVTRDDLADGGASLFAETIKKIRERSLKTLVEVLIPDLQGNWQALKTILDAAPDVLNHNIETVPGLYPEVRPQAEYGRSLELLRRAKEINCKIPTKTGIMLGLGESFAEIETTWHDLLAVGCDILTMGQYLRPSDNHLTVKRFVPPEEFDDLGEKAVALGFAGVASGPFVRSSYQAEKLYRRAVKRIQGLVRP